MGFVKNMKKSPVKKSKSRKRHPETPALAGCARCGSSLRAEAASSFCDGCYDIVIKTNGGRVSPPKRHNKRLEKSFLVEMVSKRYSVRPLSKREAISIGTKKKKQSVECRLGELERIFGLGKGPSKTNMLNTVINNEMEKRFAILELQRICRGYIVRKRQAKLNFSLIQFQKSLRGGFIRKQRILETRRLRRDAAITTQCFVRTSLSRIKVGMKRLERDRKRRAEALAHTALTTTGATVIQREVRRFILSKAFQIKRCASVKIQNLSRCYLTRTLVVRMRMQRTREIMAATVIQRSLSKALRRRKHDRKVREELEATAALKIQCFARGRASYLSVLATKMRNRTLEVLWENIGVAFSDDPESSTALVEFCEMYEDFDVEEAKVHLGLWLLLCASRFGAAVSILQACVKRGDGQDADPRAYYALAMALRMQNSPTPKPHQLVTYVRCGKRLDQRRLLLGGRRKRKGRPILYGPDGFTVIRPCLTDLDYMLRKVANMKSASISEKATRLSLYGVFRHFVEKDRAGAAFFLQQALKLVPENSFVLSCLYGKESKSSRIEVTEEDFDDDPAAPVLELANVSIRQHTQLRIRAFTRKGASKWGAKSGAFDILFEVCSSREEEVAKKTLPVSFDHLLSWVKYLDQPGLLKRCDPVSIARRLVSDLDLVRTERSTPSNSVPWHTLRLALRFQRNPVGSLLQRTPVNHHLLSLKVYLEPCRVLRIAAFCQKLDETFQIILDEKIIKQLMKDYPRSERVFSTHGWHNAITHSKLISRVAELLELEDVNNIPESARMGQKQYSQSVPVLVNGVISERPMKYKYSGHGTRKDSKYILVIRDLDSHVNRASCAWAADKITSLFHGALGRKRARLVRRQYSAVVIQKLVRGVAARRRYIVLHEELVRHKMASRIVSVVRMFLARCRLEVKCGEVLGTTCHWSIYWTILHRQRVWCSSAPGSYQHLFWLLAFDHNLVAINELLEEREGLEEDVGALYVRGLSCLLQGELSKGVQHLRAARYYDPDLLVFTEFYKQFFERAVRIQYESPQCLCINAIVNQFLYERVNLAQRYVAKVKALDPYFGSMIETQVSRKWENIRKEAAKRIQRFLLVSKNTPRTLLAVAVKSALARCCYSTFKLSPRIVPNQTALMSHAFGLLTFELNMSKASNVLDECIGLYADCAVFHFGKGIALEMLSSENGAEAEAFFNSGFRLDRKGHSFIEIFAGFFKLSLTIHRGNRENMSNALLLNGIASIKVLSMFCKGTKFLKSALETNPTNLRCIEFHQGFLFTSVRQLVNGSRRHRETMRERLKDWETKKVAMQEAKEANQRTLTLRHVKLAEERNRLVELQKLQEDTDTQKQLMCKKLVKEERSREATENGLMLAEDIPLQRQMQGMEESLLSPQEIAERRKLRKLASKRSRKNMLQKTKTR